MIKHWFMYINHNCAISNMYNKLSQYGGTYSPSSKSNVYYFVRVIKHAIPVVHFYSPEETSKHPQVKTSLNLSNGQNDPLHKLARAFNHM